MATPSRWTIRPVARRRAPALALGALLSGCGAGDSSVAEAPLLVAGGTVVTVDADDRVIPDGAVAVVGERIAAVGPRREIAERFPEARVLDAGGGLIVPGLVNLHGHAPMVLFRGLVDDLELMDWLENYIFPAEAAHVDEEFVRVGTRLACLEMLRGGTTTFVDMYYFEDAIAEEAARCGIRAVLGETLIDFPAPDHATWDEATAYTRRFVERWRGHPRVTAAVAPHSAYTVSAEHLVAARRLAAELEAPLLVHLAEDRAELARVTAATGTTPIRHLEALGLLDERLLAAHVVVPDAEEIELLAARGVAVAHCPESNMKLAAGIAPVPALLAAGVAVGLGTDGAGSNNDLDLWDEMDSAAKLHKVASGDPTALSARQTFRMATIGGARALDLQAEIGSLEPGKRADIVVVSLAAARHRPQRPEATPYAMLVYSTRPEDVTHVLVDGRPVVESGRVTTLDAAAVFAAAAELRARIEAPVAP